jgi:glycosyltransferase involved in cell wall biosynthesis
MYAYRRSVVNIVEGAEYINIASKNIARYIGRLGRLTGLPSDVGIGKWIDDCRYRYYDFGFSGVDLIHSFNATCYTSRPWVATFETLIPRFRRALVCRHGPAADFSPLRGDAAVSGAVKAMAAPSCRRLIALSRCAFTMEQALLANFPEHRAAIEAKTTVLLPPQALLAPDPLAGKPDPAQQLRFMFVGTELFRKGGGAVVTAMTRLYRRHPNIRLLLIGGLGGDVAERGDAATPQQRLTRVRAADRSAVTAAIEAGKDWIEYHPALPNDAVLQRMLTAHVGLLPTFSDSFGYSVLEFQAAGCPVISTDSRALPEINDDSVGWIIPVPKNALGEALFSTTAEHAALADAIERGLEAVIDRIAADPLSVRPKAAAAIARIRVAHDPAHYARQMQEIYAQALAGAP